MGVPNLAVVFICVLAAGAVVTVGAAFGRQLLPRRLGGSASDSDVDRESDWTRMPAEQEAYCRSVREANQMALFAQMRQQRYSADHEAQTGHVSRAAYSNEHHQQRYQPPHAHWEDTDGR